MKPMLTVGVVTVMTCKVALVALLLVNPLVVVIAPALIVFT